MGLRRAYDEAMSTLSGFTLKVALVVAAGPPGMAAAAPAHPPVTARGLAAALLGTWTHGGTADRLSFTLQADARFTLTQPGAPPLEGEAEVSGPEVGPWRLRLRPTHAAEGQPEYTLRVLDADHLGLSGGALAFEVTLARR
jgi:hypothetical protein